MNRPHMQRISEAIEEAISGMTEREMSWSPAGKWSTAQILEHLAIAFGTTARLFEKIAASGKTRTTGGTAKQRLFGFIVTGLGYFPSGRHAPEFTLPTGLAPAEAVKQIRENLRAMDAALAAAETKFGTSKPVADHPVLGPLTVAGWRRFHWVHTRHHMRQIAGLREQQGRALAATA